MAVYQHLFWILVLLPVLVSSVPEYSRGILVGNLQGISDTLHGLVSSQDYVDRIYTLHGTKVLAFDKESARIQTTISAYGREDGGTAWETITVGSCSESDSKNCVYLAKRSNNGIELLRFEEPVEANSTDTAFDVSTQENISVNLPVSTNSPENLLALVDRKADLLILQLEDSAYYAYKIANDQWGEKHSPDVALMSKTKISLQHQMVIKSIDWEKDSDTVLIQSNKNEVFIINGHTGQSLTDILKGKPHHLKLRLPKDHRLSYACWDTSTNSIFTATNEKDSSLFTFTQATSSTLDYQNDEAAGSLTRYPDCVDKNRHCTTWAKNNMCAKRRSYMVEYCARSCDVCRESERLKGRPTCADGNHMCAVWAEQGGCSSRASRDYLLQSCKASCKVCPGTNSPMAICQDMHKYCPSWANAGRCNSRPEYMNKDCAASCNKCPSADRYVQSDQASLSRASPAGSFSCKDQSEYCSDWAAKGKCDSRKDFMIMNCPSSCGLCGVQSSIIDQQSKIKCEDKSEYCLLWEAQGYCKAKQAYMSVNCRSACKLCQQQYPTHRESVSECKDKADFCATWSTYKMCTLKPVYMKENCAKSCGKCGKNETKTENSNRILNESDRQTKIDYVTSTEKPVRQSAMPADCVDKRADCSRYVEGGYCSRRRDYMSVYCQRSCSLCLSEVKGRSSSIASSSYTTRSRETVESADATPICKDSREYCRVWARAGLCKSRADVMSSICPLSCKVCNDKNRQLSNTQTTTSQPRVIHTSPTTATTIKPEEENGCVDKSGLCSLWETVGHCNSNVRAMKVYCPKTCKLCSVTQGITRPSPPQSSCQDRNRLCDSYAKANRCQLYVGYMKTNCAKSCKMCDLDTESSPEVAEVADCGDKHSFCSKWASKGYCELRADFMGKMCRKSCGRCR